jgi:hypothetical protein
MLRPLSRFSTAAFPDGARHPVAPLAEPFDEAVVPAPAELLEGSATHVEVGVHDASRLAWNVTVPLPEGDRTPARYAFELELEIPANLAGLRDPWAALQAYVRLDGSDGAVGEGEASIESFRRAVASVSSRLARARDGFTRHCTQLRSSPIVENNHWRPLSLWLQASCAELDRARTGLLRKTVPEQERALADEFLSMQQWVVLTDCGRALDETRRALEARGVDYDRPFEDLESKLAAALKDEMAYRHEARFEMAEPVNTPQLERLLARMRWLKKHFERVLFLDVESFEVVNRLAGWFTALTAMVAYLWFLLWELTLERHPVAIGSGVIAFALLTAIAYASRERMKEVARNWLAGRVQRMFAQRVTRYRLPSKERRGKGGAIVVSARESLSQAGAKRPDPVYPGHDVTHDVTVLRFVHRGTVARPPAADIGGVQQVRLIYRLDLSGIFPRLHDAVRGLASLDRQTGRVVIVDVPRNYELPLRASLRWDGNTEECASTVVLNKNGLLRVDESAQPLTGDGS